DANKVGIAKVVIRSREHLAALKPNGDALVLELMHFADEIVDMKSLDLPAQETPHANEMKVARMLIDTMTEAFDVSQFRDTYREEILAMIEARAAGKETPEAETPAPKASNVVNLMDVLQRSLEESKKSRGAAPKPKGAGAAAKSDEAESKPKKARRKKSAA
ncbi:MAG: Ku protein, partial [Candidatus Eremiobacteraeota bacterium]|nr:Ku protein [Candidatus Eremiobacteraeota bacterium]